MAQFSGLDPYGAQNAPLVVNEEHFPRARVKRAGCRFDEQFVCRRTA
jgi:hypothetical protein